MALISPKPTLSLVASLFNQNPTQLSTTIRVQGTYTCSNTGVTGHIDNYFSFLAREKGQCIQRPLPHLDEEVSGVPLQQEDHLQHREHPRGVAGEVHLHVTAINHREYFMETEIFLTPSLVCRP